MAKPRELYSGPAPQAMSLMGQGIADAYANVGRIEGQGMQAMGEGIARGITAAAGAVADYKKMSSQVKADTAAFNSFKNYLPPEFVKLQQTMENDPKVSLLDKQQFYQSAKGYLGAAIGQKYKMEQIGAEQKGLYDRAVATKKPPLDLGGLDMAIDSIWNPKPAPSSTQPSMQDTTAPATDLAAFLRSRGWSGRGPVPQALMDEYNASIGR
jgi:hypothetical protein